MATLLIDNPCYIFTEDTVSPCISGGYNFGAIAVIKGRTGSGKTLLLQSICGIITPSSGMVTLTVNNIKQEGIFIHSQPELNFVTGSVKEELELSGIYGTEFDKYFDKNIFELSGGELKKISVLMALKSTYSAVILDEPLDMLDDYESDAISKLISKACREKVFIIATHDNCFDSSSCLINLNCNDYVQPFIYKRSLNSGRTVLSVNNIKAHNINASEMLSFSLHQNEIICIYGKNGTGKTMLIKTLASLIPAESGSVEYAAKPGFCLQFPEYMTSGKTVEDEIFEIAGNKYTSAVIDKLKWEDKKKLSPFSLSSGQRRIMYIISFLTSKDICIFDEPFAGLDGITASFIKTQFMHARDSGKSILYTANRHNDTQCCDTLIKLK